MATKVDLMTTLCSAFGVFSAFGAAILAFFTGAGGLHRLGRWLVDHEKKRTGVSPEKAMRRGDALVWLVAGVISLAVLISGVGLFTSFFWLRAVANGSGHASRWAYTFADNMFYLEAIVITVITVAAVVAAAFAVRPSDEKANASNQSPRPAGQAAEL
jgi:hypothetical protein